MSRNNTSSSCLRTSDPSNRSPLPAELGGPPNLDYVTPTTWAQLCHAYGRIMALSDHRRAHALLELDKDLLRTMLMAVLRRYHCEPDTFERLSNTIPIFSSDDDE